MLELMTECYDCGGEAEYLELARHVPLCYQCIKEDREEEAVNDS